jgi:hypothetical protein
MFVTHNFERFPYAIDLDLETLPRSKAPSEPMRT